MNTRSQAGRLIVTIFTNFFQPCLPQLGAGVNLSSARLPVKFPYFCQARYQEISHVFSEETLINLKKGVSMCRTMKEDEG